MTADLVAFLRDRLAEDEQAARALGAAGDRWVASAERFGPRVAVGPNSGDWWDRETSAAVWQCDDPEDGCLDASEGLMAEAAHIARHDPARVLAEVDAKRRIIDEHEPSWSSGEPEYDHHHEKAVSESGRTRYIEVRDNDPVPPYWCSCCQSSAPCQTLRLLALPFADHPDYQPEWAPEA